MTYVARYRREDDAWLVDIVDEPGCHTYGRTLSQARQRIREALALWLDVDDEATLQIDDEFDLPVEVESALIATRAARAAEDRMRRQAVDLLAHATHLLSGLAFTVRDAAAVLEVSHQRVQQLLAKPDPLAGVLFGDPHQPAPHLVREAHDSAPAYDDATGKVVAGREADNTQAAGVRDAKVALPSADEIVSGVRNLWSSIVRHYLLLDEPQRLAFIEELVANAATPTLLTVANDLSKLVERRLAPESGGNDASPAVPSGSA